MSDVYEEQGYVIYKRLFYKTEIKWCLNKIKKVFERQIKRRFGEKYSDKNLIRLFKEDPDTVKNSGKVIQNLPEIARLMYSTNIISNLVGFGIREPVITTRPVTFFHNKNLAESEVYYKTPQHQDYPSMESSINSVVVWIPLVDCMEDSIGPLEIVPKSHKEGILTERVENNFAVTSKYNDPDFQKVYMEQGDVLIFNSLLVHRSGHNTSDMVRFFTNFRYGDLAAKDWIERGYKSPYIYKPVFDVDSVNKLKEFYK